MTNSSTFIGWDIGGAHLKITVLNGQGVVQDVRQIYTPLWRGLDSLVDGLRLLPESVTQSADHAVTMTGELADCFSHKQEGVKTLAHLFTSIHSTDRTFFYAGQSGWLSEQQILNSPEQATESVASMNWHATARLASEAIVEGLFVDIGSTTTDLIPLKNGKPVSKGNTDFTRLQHHELEYMGVIRTPVPMMVNSVVLNGRSLSLAREFFASMADVYRLTGDIEENDYLLAEEESADGEDWSTSSCARRIARLVCCDVDDYSRQDWQKMAQGIANQQLKILSEALDHVSEKTLFEGLDARTHLNLVAAGAGDFLIRKLAQRRDLAYHDLSDLIHAENADLKKRAAICAPATACAMLLRKTIYEN